MSFCCANHFKKKELDHARLVSHKIFLEQVAHAKKKYIGKYNILTKSARHDYYTYVARAFKTLMKAENNYEENLTQIHKVPKDIICMLPKKNAQLALDMSFALLIGAITTISIEYCQSLSTLESHNNLKMLDLCLNNKLQRTHHDFEERTHKFTRVKFPMRVSPKIFINI